jgi:uncharacterized protein YbaR (Trm112 family)
MDRPPVRVLCCPQCSAALNIAPQGDLDRTGCSLTYPVRHGVPILVIGEASSRPAPTDPDFERLVAEAIAAPVSGWDFGWLDSRRTTSIDRPADLPEPYDTRACTLVAQANAVPDVGTGDGRRFARYAPFPAVAVAAEGYAPNVPLAVDDLERLGVEVVRTDGACHNSRGPQPGNRWPQRRLPFADNAFDLLLAHRAAFSPLEAARVLRAGGQLLTCQGGTEWRGETLADALGGTPPEWTLPGFGWDVGDSFRQAGLRILEWSECAVTITYHDIAEVVYELLHVPWSVVDFDLDRYRACLFRLHRRMQVAGGFRRRGYSYTIEAQKPWQLRPPALRLQPRSEPTSRGWSRPTISVAPCSS